MIRFKYTYQNKIELIMYMHENKKNIGTVIIFPGGGFTHCELSEGKGIAKKYYARGYDVIVANYIVGHLKKHLNFDELIKRLINIKYILKELHLENYFFVGFSAGGYAALIMSLYLEMEPIGIILGYPLIQGFEDIDILHLLAEKSRPIFLFATFDDHVVSIKHSLLLINRIYNTNNSCEIHIFDHGHHGIGVKGQNKTYNKWFELSIEWLERLIDKEGY